MNVSTDVDNSQAAMTAHLHTLLAPASLSTAAAPAAGLPALTAASSSQGPPPGTVIQVQHHHWRSPCSGVDI